jgi:hypothetical protein
MNQYLGRSANICLLLALGLLTTVVIFYVPSYSASAPQTAGLEVADLWLGELSVGASEKNAAEIVHPIELSLTNRSSAPIRVVGIDWGCLGGFCIAFDLKEGIVLQPGKTIRLPGKLKCGAGAFSGQSSVWYDDGCLRQARFTIQGCGVLP